MAKEFSKQFYGSSAWIKCRASYIASVQGLCERCLEKGYIVNGYIVHHKILLTPNNIDNPDVTLNWNELEYLCQPCHNTEHMGTHKQVVREGLEFNSKGERVKKEDV